MELSTFTLLKVKSFFFFFLYSGGPSAFGSSPQSLSHTHTKWELDNTAQQSKMNHVTSLLYIVNPHFTVGLLGLVHFQGW